MRQTSLPFASGTTLPFLKLVVLLADTPAPAVVAEYGTYHDVFSLLFERSIKLQIEEGKREEEEQFGGLLVESYNAVAGELPTKEQVKDAHGVLITGSAFSAYEPLPWITSLIAFVSSIPTVAPASKVIGICFGHQIVGLAFGGACVKNTAGWEVGTTALQLSARGREVFGKVALREEGVLEVQEMHQDHVPALPEGFEVLASTERCFNQGMARFSSTGSAGLKAIEVITLQGHPEFTGAIVGHIIDRRERVFGPELTKEGRERAARLDEGVKIGRVLLGVLGWGLK